MTNQRRARLAVGGLLALLASGSAGAEAPSWRLERGELHILVPLKPGGAFNATSPSVAGTLTLDAAHSKSGRARTFPFGQLAPLAELLREQRERTSALERERGRIIPHVFHIDGQPIGSFRTVWRSAVKKAGLPGLRPHDLRRSAAREFVRTVTSESVAMALLGHRTRSMFDRYNITSTQDLAEAIVTAIPGDQLQISYMARRKVVELNGIEPSTS